MAYSRLKEVERVPGPSHDLPKYRTYITLGCMGCQFGTCFEVNGLARGDQVSEAVSHISPRMVTRGAFARSDANVVCPDSRMGCPSADPIENARAALLAEHSE